MSLDRTALALCVDVLGPLRPAGAAARTVTVPGVRRRALLALLALEAAARSATERLVDGAVARRAAGERGPGAVQPRLPAARAPRRRSRAAGAARRRLPAAPRARRAGRGRRSSAGRRRRRAGTPLPAPRSWPASALELWRGRRWRSSGAARRWRSSRSAWTSCACGSSTTCVEARLALARAVTSSSTRRRGRRGAPLRERTALLHVRALAADGRTAEAMAAAQAFRRRLADETGLDPGPALAELEQQVAAGDARAARRAAAGLAPAPGGPPRRPAGRPRARPRGGTSGCSAATRPSPSPAPEASARPGSPSTSPPSPGGARGRGADVVVVDLAAVDRPDRVCQAVASTLGLRTTGEVTADDVAAALAGATCSCVLDNCEHLPDACRDLVVTVRRTAPGVRVLATSRVTLHVPGEYVVRLQPLPVPRDRLRPGRAAPAAGRARVPRARPAPARRLRADRGRRGRPRRGAPPPGRAAARDRARRPPGGGDAADATCATAWTGPSTWPPAGARRRRPAAHPARDHRLVVPAAAATHEQCLLRAMAPFPGGVDLATVEVLARRRSARRRPGRPAAPAGRRLAGGRRRRARGRYRLLFTVRAFLLDELRGAAASWRRPHARFLDRCLARGATRSGPACLGPDEPAVDRRLRAELDNLRAARDLARGARPRRRAGRHHRRPRRAGHLARPA